MGEDTKDIHDLKGLYDHEIRALFGGLEVRLSAVEKSYGEMKILVLDKHADALQAVANYERLTDYKLTQMDKRGDERHEQNQASIKDNGDKVDRLTWWMLGGAVAAAGSLLMQIINAGHHA